MSKKKRSAKQSESQGTHFNDSSVENFDQSLAEGSTLEEDSLPNKKCDGREGEDDNPKEEEKVGVGDKQSRKNKPPAKKKTKTLEESVSCCTERDALLRSPLPPTDSARSFTALSWNVNGLRATVRNGLGILRQMVKTERPDLVCIQETKLQEKDVEAMRQQDVLPGYASVWSCSTKKKGYAGTAVFFTKQAEPWTGDGSTPGEAASEPVKKKQKKQGKISAFFVPNHGGKSKENKPTSTLKGKATADAADPADVPAALPGGRSGAVVLGVRLGIGDSRHDGEGRSITVEYEKFFVVTLYVPNSGQKLERLPYRTEEWDVALRAYVGRLEAEGKPVVVCGDLNVAHLDLDIYNAGAKHLVKSAGTTKEERESFDSWVKEGKVVDAFRRLHPTAKGAYTYWSMRTNARPVNKGLRLDYVLCSESLFRGVLWGGGAKQMRKGGGREKGKTPKAGEAAVGRSVAVQDCFQLEKATVGLSDHCPVGITLLLSA